MDREDIQDLVISALRHIQEMSGREVPEEITDKTCPIRDLVGFETIRGVEFATILSKDMPLPLDFNPCVSADGKKALSVREIVDRVQSVVGDEEGAGNE